LQHKYSIQLKSKATKNLQKNYVSDWCSRLRRIVRPNINRKQEKQKAKKNHLETSLWQVTKVEALHQIHKQTFLETKSIIIYKYPN
jgi:hypothetical protein